MSAGGTICGMSIELPDSILLYSIFYSTLFHQSQNWVSFSCSHRKTMQIKIKIILN
jgi:hypothetical protein